MQILSSIVWCDSKCDRLSDREIDYWYQVIGQRKAITILDVPVAYTWKEGFQNFLMDWTLR